MPVEALVIKAREGEDIQPSNAAGSYEEDLRAFTQLNAIVPPYDPRDLCKMVERSSALRPNIDAYKVNIEGFGYRLEPTLNPNAPDATERIRQSLLLEKIHDGAGGKRPAISDAEVEARRAEILDEIAIERAQTELFLESFAGDLSLVELRERTRTDEETTGNGYWEVLRDGAGLPAQATHVPSITMRLMRSDEKFVDVEVDERISHVSFRKKTRKRRFRRFVQVIWGELVAYFREFGDPRTLSRKTGVFFESVESMRAKEGEGAVPATEIYHFKIHSPETAYGVPRWIGATLAVLGTRASEEVNQAYFENKTVPPFAIMVSGGRLAAGAADRITNYLRDNIQGQENFHNVLVLEAEPAGNAAPIGGGGAQGSRVRIEIKTLTEAQQQDALFQNYESNNEAKVGNAFRLPKLLRGATDSINRATAEAALVYAEQQVFQPERQKVDDVLNRILVMRGVRFHKLVSNSPVAKDPAAVVDMVTKLVEACVITAEEARPFVSDAFNADLARSGAPWTRIPYKLLLAGIQPPPTPEELEAAAARGADAGAKSPNVQIAPTDAVTLLTVNEARAALGLGPFLGSDGKESPEGSLSVAEFQGKAKGMAVTGGASPGPQKPPPTLEEQAKGVLDLREILRSMEGVAAKAALSGARLGEAERVVKVPQEEFARWFAPEGEPSAEA